MTLATMWMQINATRQLLDKGSEERTMNGQGCYLSPAWKGSSAFNARGILGQAAIGEAMNQAAGYSIRFLLHITGRADPVKSYSETEESALQLCECKASLERRARKQGC